MEKYFANYEQSLALKELGFDMPCFRYVYIDNDKQINEVKPRFSDNFNSSKLIVSIPLKQQVFRWFREEHHMFSHIMTYEGNEIPRFKGEFAYFAEIDFLIASEEIEKPFKTYEEAESACIDRLIEIVKNK